MNILLLSVGTRNKIVQYFKQELEGIGKVIVTDASKLAPAIYEADKYYIVPKIFEENYLETILDICKKENIKGILSLIDPELNILAENEKEFEKIGVKIVGSGLQQCEYSFDKIKFSEKLIELGYKTPRSYQDIIKFQEDYVNGQIGFPVFVKPIKGSASISINKVDDLKSLEVLFENSEDLMVQEYMDGQEYGVDVYIDMISKKIISVFMKEKILMRAGETDKARSFKDKNLLDIVSNFVEDMGYTGQIDIDIFDIDGEYYISEVNPRFGGGYPHAYECGVNHMKLIINNLAGKTNKPDIGNYEENIYMMKYNEVFTFRDNEVLK